jgi:hypothetical protein
MEKKYNGAGVFLIERYHNKCAIIIVKELNGLWSVPGGRTDDNDEPNETAARELFEETNGLFYINPTILKNHNSYDLVNNNNKYYKAYFVHINSKNPISRENYYYNFNLINSYPFDNYWKETHKLDRLYLDIFLRDNTNYNNGTFKTYKASNGTMIELCERDARILNNNIDLIKKIFNEQPMILQYNDNYTINNVNGFHTYYNK